MNFLISMNPGIHGTVFINGCDMIALKNCYIRIAWMGACRECGRLFMFENVEPEVRNPMERLFT